MEQIEYIVTHSKRKHQDNEFHIAGIVSLREVFVWGYAVSILSLSPGKPPSLAAPAYLPSSDEKYWLLTGLWTTTIPE